MRKRLIIFLSGLLLVWASAAHAVSMDTLHTTFVVKSDFVPLHVVTGSIGGGLHPMMYSLNPDYMSTVYPVGKLGAGGTVQATYSYFFHKYVAVTGGIGFKVSTGRTSGAFSDKTYLYDHINQMQYWFNADYYDFYEQHQLYQLEIPVGITGRVSLSDHWSLKGTVGLGMDVIVGSNYHAHGKLTTTGDYPDYLVHFDPDLPQHGFSDYYLGGFSDKISNTFPVNMFVFADLGAHYQFTRRWGLYFGLYVDYTCFNSIRVESNTANLRNELLYFDPKLRQILYNGMINSKFVNAVNPLFVGVKVGVTISFLDPKKCNCENW